MRLSRNRASLGRRTTSLVGCLLILVGCNAKPHAPALEDTSVYQNDREGFRFLVPSGWSQRAKTDVPRGKYAAEQLLVQFVGRTAGGTAVLEAAFADVDPSEELGARLAKPTHSLKKWTLAHKPEEIEINGVSATRFVFQGEREKPFTKEVVAFRRGERVYFLTAVFSSADAEARAQVRRAIASTLWKHK